MPKTNGKATIREVHELIDKRFDTLLKEIIELKEVVSCLKGESKVWGGIVGGAVAAIVAWWVKQ
jgi:hypothetical protein